MHIKFSYVFIFLATLLLSACDLTPEAEETIELSPEGFFAATLTDKYALTGNIRGNAELWQLQPQKLLHSWQHSDKSTGIMYTAIADNGEYALTAEKNSLAWWRISDGQLLNIWLIDDINAIAISSNGKSALIGLADKALYFSLSLAKTVYILPHKDKVTQLDLSKSGLLAITGSNDHTAKLWDLNSGKLKHTWEHRSNLSKVAISPNGAYALTNEGLGTIKIWKPRTGKLHRELGAKLITLSSLSFSSNSRQVVVGQLSRRIDLWDISSGELQSYWRPKKQRDWIPSAATIIALSFAEKNNKIYSIASNGYLQRWNAAP